MASPGHDFPLEFSQVLDREREEIATRRAAAEQPAPRREQLAGLALSGGGIRSATFCLGVLQALKARGVLRDFDYLSTVSGGGFVGGWWSAFLSRPWGDIAPGRRPADEFFPDAERIEAQRAPEYQNVVAKRKEGSISAGVDPVHHLRLFSNYLTPRRGLLGADTWRAVAFTSRNMLLTWIILLPLLFAAVVSAQLYFVSTRAAVEASAAGAAGPSASIVRGITGVVPGVTDPLTESVARDFLAPAPRDSAGRAAAAYGARLADRARVAARPVLVLALVFGTLTLLWLLQGGARRAATLTGIGAAAFIFWSVRDAFVSGEGPALLPGLWGVIALVGVGLAVARFGVAPLLGALWRVPPEPLRRASREMPVESGSRIGRAWRWIRITWNDGAMTIARRVRAGWRGVPWVPPVTAQSARYPRPTPLTPPHVPTVPPSEMTMRHRVMGAWYGLTEALDDGSVFRRERRRNVIGAWQSRMLIGLVLLAIVLAFAGFAHDLVAWLFGWGGPVAKAGGTLAALAAGASALFTAVRGAPSGGSDGDAREPSRMSRLVFAAAPLLVLGALLVAFAELGHRLLEAAATGTFEPTALRTAMLGGAAVCFVFATVEVLTDAVSTGHARGANKRVVGLVLTGVLTTMFAGSLGMLGADPATRAAAAGLGLAAACLTGVIALGWTTDPNLIAMHAFYRARLVRAYMGASNPRRRNEEIRDTAANDDIRLHKLDNCARGAPYHLVNTTLNLVGGRDLATAQRHAASFLLSKHACGSVRTGWRPTSAYMGGRMTIGTAVAISGAAASPNMGTKSMSGAVAMLLALLNVRLGYWAPTPNRPRWQARQAGLWPFYFLREFLSQTNDLSVYSYLTDGGHFDNTGVYSLVERGCTRIVVADCGADPRPSFTDAGDLIRRCRIDFGAELRLDVRPFQRGAEGWAQEHVIEGTVEYAAAHVRALGWPEAACADDERGRQLRRGSIVWIKPALTGSERADLRQYALENPVFPQQSTADQWFDEAQFESYRALGVRSGHAAAAVLGAAAVADEAMPADWLLREDWDGRLVPAVHDAVTRYLFSAQTEGGGNGEHDRHDQHAQHAELVLSQVQRLLGRHRASRHRDEIRKPRGEQRTVDAGVDAVDLLVARAVRAAERARGSSDKLTPGDLTTACRTPEGSLWPF